MLIEYFLDYFFFISFKLFFITFLLFFLNKRKKVKMEKNLKEFKKHLKMEKFKNKYNKSLHQSVNLNSLI